MKGLAIILALLAFGVDQVSKYWVEATLPLREVVPVLPMFSLFRTYNTGIAFSFFAGLPDGFLIVLTLFISCVVLWLWWRLEAHRKWAGYGFALILGGALGNLVDRAMLGHVVDFLLFHTQSWSFAIFNLADSFITVGAALIVFDEILEIRRNQRGAAANHDKEG